MRKNRHRAIGPIPAILATLLAACSGGGETPWTSAAPAAREVPRPALVDGVFPTAEAAIAEAAVPERFHRELPATVAAFETTWNEYPSAHIRKLLCAGDPEMGERFARAVAAAAAAGDPPEKLRSTYGQLLEWCDRPEGCRWAREAIAGGEPVAEVAWVALARCGAEAEALFDSPLAPAGLVIEYWSDRSWHDDYEPRFVPALSQALWRVAQDDQTMLTRRGAMLLGRADDPQSARTLLSLYDTLSEGETRDAIVTAMGDLSSPRARQLFEEYCERSEGRDPVCSSDWQTTAEEETFPVPSLVTDPEASELAARLEELGLLQPVSGASLSEPDLTPGEILMRSATVDCFDVETDMFPNEHDALLYGLVALSGAPLAEAVFEEIPPPMEMGQGSWWVNGREVDELPVGTQAGDPYRLRAYLEDRSYAVDAQDFGDWYDLDQVLGLLNAMAADQGAITRFVTLPGDGQVACVLAAPRDAILAGIAEGLLEVGQSGEAMSEGKAFEEVVLERLRSGELELN